MAFLDVQEHIDLNLKVVRLYLQCEFPDYVLTEVEDSCLLRKFAVTNAKLDKHYKLKVALDRLADPKIIPTTIFAALNYDDVAGKMRLVSDYFTW